MKFPLKPLAAALALPLLAQTPVPAPIPAPEPAKVAGADLPTVPGPMGRTLELADPAIGFEISRTDARFRTQARGGNVPAVAVPAGDVCVDHWVTEPAGWMAYQVEAAPMETVKARLRGVHSAWFQVKVVNKWGQVGAGMLQNRISTGNAEASFINRTGTPQTVFFVVDTSTMIMGKEPYTLTFTRE